MSNVQLSIVGESIYKPGWDNHKLNESEGEELEEYISSVRNDFSFKINLSAGMPKDIYLGNKEFKTEFYNQRGLCSGNVSQVYILPDGNVTICEELMFNPNFILGNIINEDLENVWKANRLEYLSERTSYQNSRCGKCKEFENCKGVKSKGVCWKEIIHAYGEEKWNFPDPKCPYAPRKMNHFF